MRISINTIFLFATLASLILTSACTTSISAQGNSGTEKENAFTPPSPPEGWTEHYVLANDIRIHYWRTGGNKPVLILAHGFSDNGLCWTNLAKEFTDDFDIIMYYARGHGLSDPPRMTDSADSQTEDLAALIKELKLEKPILMGHSMGSSSVTWFAARYPDVPKAIILEAPRLIPKPEEFLKTV